MKILLLGKYGQLGWELRRALSGLGQVEAHDYPEIDFTKPQALREFVLAQRPDLIFNAVAYTAVDQAESEPEKARMVNATAVCDLAEAAKKLGAGFIHYSTDFVFDGRKGSPYQEGDTPNPLNVYGQTKLEGEQAVQLVGGAYLILRTSWVYSLRRDSFTTKVLGWAHAKEVLRIVDDQYGSPTWARLLAELTVQAIVQGRADPTGWLEETAGLYHLAGDGAASRFEWAKAVTDLDPNQSEQALERLEPAKTSEFPAPAERPAYSALNCDKFARVFGLRLPPWRQALWLAMEVEGH